MRKEYLGDSVYVEIDEDTQDLILTTDNEKGLGKAVVLESEVYAGLVDYITIANKEAKPANLMNAQKDKILHEKQRKQLWISIAVAVARSSCSSMTELVPGVYANATLASFDRTFPQIQEKQS